MWTSTLELKPTHVLLTKILGRFWRGAYFSALAPLQVQNVPRQPLPAANWVRVRNILAGICGSDLPLIFVDGDLRIAPAALPRSGHSYPGHEVVGEVIEVGDEVQYVHIGDRVVLQHGSNCVSAGIQIPCRSCAAGNYSLCESGNLAGPQPIGGGWSEEMLVHENQLFRVPLGMTDEQAVLLEPTAVALHTVLRHLPQPGDHVLVIGAGTIGLLILQVLRALAPQIEMSVQARHPFQIEQATRMGAAHIIYPQDSYAEVQRATGGQLYQGMFGNRMLLGGYDVIYDTVGDTRTLSDALRWARAGATVVMVGLNLHKMLLDLTPIWYQEINLLGTTGHGMETWPPATGETEKESTFAIATEMIEHGVLQPDRLITHRFPLTSYRDALLTTINKKQSRAMKVVFDYSLLPPSVVPNVRATRQRRAVPPTIGRYQPQIPMPEEDDELIAPNASEYEDLSESTIEMPSPASAEQPPSMPMPVAPALSAMIPPPTLTEGNEDDVKTVVVPKSKRTRQKRVKSDDPGAQTPFIDPDPGEPGEQPPPAQEDNEHDPTHWISSLHIVGGQGEQDSSPPFNGQGEN